MAATGSRSISRGPDLRRSVPPGSRFCAPSSPFSRPGTTPPSTFPSKTSLSFSPARSPNPFGFLPPSTRVHLVGIPSSPSSTSPTALKKPAAVAPPAPRRRTCTCAPTTHPGSFRCSLHRNAGCHLHQHQRQHLHQHQHGGDSGIGSPWSSGLSTRRSAMANPLVRIGAVEGSDLIKRALAALIRPSSHQQRRRAAFQPRPSRLSKMSTAEDLR